MLRILLINAPPKKVGRLKCALIEIGFEVIDESGLLIDLPEHVETTRCAPDHGRDVQQKLIQATEQIIAMHDMLGD